MTTPLRVHPENPKLFELRGKACVLLCATEHYGAVMNRPFRFKRYLDDAAQQRQTLTRLFLLFREQQTHCNPYSTCKPESTDYVAPFERVGSGMALDGQPKFDLSRWNAEFFERLHRFLALASERGIVVELCLFSNFYTDDIWCLQPLHPGNNINGLDDMPWQHSMTLRNQAMWRWQSAYARKIVNETKQYDNIIYEVCNEPAGHETQQGLARVEPREVDGWQRQIIEIIRDADHNQLNHHLIAGQPAFSRDPWRYEVDVSFDGPAFDVINIHSVPDLLYQGRHYDLSDFMSGQLRLQDLRDFSVAIYKHPKPVNHDEDNAATQYRDTFGWMIHRKRAWTTLFCGAHYNMIDFSIWPHLETGTPESRRHLRTWFKHLSEFIQSVNLICARPLPGWIEAKPDHVVEAVLAVEGEDYCIYVADGRERDEAGVGSPIHGRLTFDLPETSFDVSCYSPVSGQYSPSHHIKGTPDHILNLPVFEHDLVVRLRRS